MVNTSFSVVKRPLLYLGLIFMLVGCVLPIFLQQSDDGYSDRFSHLINNSGYAFFLVIACVVGPITEELSFRYWAKGTIFAKIISIAGIVIFSYMSYGSLISLAILLALAVLFFVFNFKTQILSFVVTIAFSGLLFALQHESFPLTMNGVANIIGKIGFSFIAIYLTVRWSIWFSIIFHSVWNATAVLSTFYILSLYSENIPALSTINSDLFSANVIYKADANDGYYSKTVTEDSLILKNVSMTRIIKVLSEDENDYILMESGIDILFKFDLLARVTDKSSFKVIKDSIIAKYNLAFDTITPSDKHILIDFESSASVNNVNQNISIPITYIEERLNRVLGKKVIIRNTLEHVLMSGNSFDAMQVIKDRDSLISVLKREGINILTPTESGVKLVTVSIE